MGAMAAGWALRRAAARLMAVAALVCVCAHAIVAADAAALIVTLPDVTDGVLVDPQSVRVVVAATGFPAGGRLNVFVDGEVVRRVDAAEADVTVPITGDGHGELSIGATVIDASGTVVAEEWQQVEVRRRDVAAGRHAVTLASRMGEGGDMLGAIALLDDAAREDDWLSYDIKYMSGFFRYIMGDAMAGYRDVRLALALEPDDPYDCAALTLIMQMVTHFCEWSRWSDDVALFQRRFHEKLAMNETILVPFFHYTLGIGPADALRQARVISHDVAARVNPDARARAPDLSLLDDLGEGPLRVGLFNMAGFSGHDLSIGRFLQAYLGSLRPSDGVAIVCYSNAQEPDNGKVFERCSAGCAAFHDVSKLGADETHALIVSHRLHVMVETAGFSWSAFRYTRRSMHFHSKGFDLLARRVAPIQTQFHGYPGTHGADFVDSVTLDALSVTPELSEFLSEALWLHPSCYLVSEHPMVHRFVLGEYDEGDAPLDPAPTRADIGVERDDFLFATFNREFKYTPEVFGVWMRILLRVPNSKLWIMRFEPLAVPFLKQWAQAYGVEAERLVFTDKFPTRKAEYATKGLADLFLDTPLFNGHTTVLDALWAGVPVLTTPGETVASRVAAAALVAGGMSIGIARDLADYEELAVAIASGVSGDALWLQAHEARVFAPLWDLAQWTRSMASMQRMAADAARAMGPRPRMMHIVGAGALGGASLNSDPEY